MNFPDTGGSITMKYGYSDKVTLEACDWVHIENVISQNGVGVVTVNVDENSGEARDCNIVAIINATGEECVIMQISQGEHEECDCANANITVNNEAEIQTIGADVEDIVVDYTMDCAANVKVELDCNCDKSGLNNIPDTMTINADDEDITIPYNCEPIEIELKDKNNN